MKNNKNNNDLPSISYNKNNNDLLSISYNKNNDLLSISYNRHEELLCLFNEDCLYKRFLEKNNYLKKWMENSNRYKYLLQLLNENHPYNLFNIESLKFFATLQL